MKNILFRADSSSQIGLGHIMRDLVLASRYPNSNIVFACKNLSGNINKQIIKNDYKLEIISSNDIKELSNIIYKYDIDMIIIDNYDIDYKFEKQLKKTHNNLTILSLDDTYQKHHCDILLNHNINANKKKYKKLVPKHCDIRCGIKHTLIRDEFIKEKRALNVLLVMGGADSSNLNIEILKVLKKFDNIRVQVLSTKSNKNIQKLKKYTKNNKFTNLSIDTKKMAKYMKNSDFIICTPSVTINEAYYMDLPFISIKTADNQNEIHQFLKKNNFLALNKFNPKKLNKLLKKMVIKCKK